MASTVILTRMTMPTLLDLEALAEKTGLTYATVRSYHNHAEARRRDGNPRPGDLPPPDKRFGRSPAWLEKTIDELLANRPGRGAGGGRPPKRAQE
ncbi:hypothetical protein GR925_22275 [Streptomyces sp. HUCO-GS316]|uniref:hypothetical protein n=1 Tax=Streptomyces sp. HUCO-GS316 TaxID=2692198 RepID=UPI0013FFB990|nr:hypothetical protein [Streptomyces sp. HUCO-GS316]MXM66100.1 hypothetical protein [Streptomyces sp. HUCO-GS316]